MARLRNPFRRAKPPTQQPFPEIGIHYLHGQFYGFSGGLPGPHTPVEMGHNPEKLHMGPHVGGWHGPVAPRHHGKHSGMVAVPGRASLQGTTKRFRQKGSAGRGS